MAIPFFERIEAEKRKKLEELRAKSEDAKTLEELGDLPEQRIKTKLEIEAAVASRNLILEIYDKYKLSLPDFVKGTPNRTQKTTEEKPNPQSKNKPIQAEESAKEITSWKLTHNSNLSDEKTERRVNGGILEINGKEIELTQIEFVMLSLLASAPGKTFSPQEISEAVYGNANPQNKNNIHSIKLGINRNAQMEIVGRGKPYGFVFIAPPPIEKHEQTSIHYQHKSYESNPDTTTTYSIKTIQEMTGLSDHDLKMITRRLQPTIDTVFANGPEGREIHYTRSGLNKIMELLNNNK